VHREVFEGAAAAVRYASRGSGLWPGEGAEVEAWVSLSARLVAGPTLESALSELNAALSDGRTLLVPSYDHPSAGDVAVWGALAAYPKFDAARKTHPHVARWHAQLTSAHTALPAVLEKHMPAAARAAKAKVAAMQAAKAATAAAATAAGAAPVKENVGGSFDIGLKDAVMGQVCTRFPPEPSGYLHIGHAKAALLNEYFARTYQGRLILRFDDTNPAKENDDFVQAILGDVAALDIVPDAVTYTSDHFDALLVKAAELIQSGHAYVDDTPVDVMRAERMDGIKSRRRGQSVEENLALWAAMLSGSERGAMCCLRFKIDMSAPNKALRDPVAYRVNAQVPHHRTGDKYKVYPTYDCACPFVDAVEGVTHALRTSEYRDREAQYVWIQQAMGVRTVHIWDYSRLNFEYTTLSKRKLGAFVTSGKVHGWDDPRFPTVAGMRRRGLTVAALREFILSQGASRNINTMTWEKLWTLNKRVIDPVCPRHTAVEAARVLLTLTNGPSQPDSRPVPRHKKHPPAGDKPQWRASTLWVDAADAGAIADGEELTLMDWGNCVIESVTRGPDGIVTALHGRLHLEGDVKSTKLKMTWLAAAGVSLTALVLKEYEHLITKRKVEDEDDVAQLFNSNSERERTAWGDVGMLQLKKGDALQLERKGYWICDVAAHEGAPAVLLSIPDGREKKAEA